MSQSFAIHQENEAGAKDLLTSEINKSFWKGLEMQPENPSFNNFSLLSSEDIASIGRVLQAGIFFIRFIVSIPSSVELR